jgi:hypothetical protein
VLTRLEDALQPSGTHRKTTAINAEMYRTRGKKLAFDGGMLIRCLLVPVALAGIWGYAVALQPELGAPNCAANRCMP